MVASLIETNGITPSSSPGVISGSAHAITPGIDKLAMALAKAQSEMTNPKKTHTATGKSFSYHYADLAEIIDTVRPVLSKHGIAYVQVVRSNGKNILETRLIHESGQFLDSTYPLPETLMDAQAMGSAITYARRYSLCAILGIAAEDDEDGLAATEAAHTAEEEKKRLSAARFEEMKKRGNIASAYDGKVLKPGEHTLPEKRIPPPAAPASAGASPQIPADLNPALAARMSQDSVTLEQLKAFGVARGHFPASMDMTVLRPELVAAYLKPENWAKVLEFASKKGPQS